MGNNEVVGPFGAGTVFGQQTPPLPVIRATLTLKSTRTGQLLETLSSGWKNSAEQSDWRGMEMFLDQQVRGDDPRLATVYQNFQRNLTDIVRLGRKCGAGIVLSSVAVNLKDCAPFASTNRAGLTTEAKSNWDLHFGLGVQAQSAGRLPEAGEHFQSARKIDGTFAELEFRQAQCALALGQTRAAQDGFRSARDCDTLRFRCDSRLNSIIRQSASNAAADRVLFADAEGAFAEHSPAGLPGADLFYEHVHLTFAGNYLLAKTVAAQVEKLLPAGVTTNTPMLAWPSEADCARRLGWGDWSRLAALEGILVRATAPPFTGQINHDAQMRTLTTLMEQLTPAISPTGVAAARANCEAALTRAPDDAILHGHLAALKLTAGDLAGAAESERRELDLQPANSQAWQRLGMILSRQQKLEEAITAFQRAITLNPADVFHRQNLAQSFWQLGRREEAINQLRHALRQQPNFALGWISQGQLLAEQGRIADAEAGYQRALACRVFRSSDLLALARFCRSRGWHEPAATNFVAAIKLNPHDAKLRLETAQCLLTLRRDTEATRLIAEAVQLSPDLPAARQMFGLALGQQGKPIEAEQQFREALRLAPDMLEARLNLGVALMNQGRAVEARSQLEDVLQRSPTNALALRYLDALRASPRTGQP
jgi:tetratricopeptide (TPR) repeat protein